MMIMIAAALAVAPPAATAAPVDPHSQHQQGQKHEGHGCCCCKDMAKAGHKMEGCAEHGEGHGGEHAEHGATR